MAVQLAYHYHQADEYERAFHYYALAGERAPLLPPIVCKKDEKTPKYSGSYFLYQGIS